MSDKEIMNEDALQAEIDQARIDLSAALEDLTRELSPAVQIGYLAEDTKETVAETVQGVREGNPDAIVRVAIIAGVAILVTTLTVRHCSKKGRRRREIRQWKRFLRQVAKQEPPASMDFSIH